MLMQRALLLLSLCLVLPAQAGLLDDDQARQQIKQLEARVLTLEDTLQKTDLAAKQQTKSMMDLQSQIDALNLEIRKLRGQNEEAAHGLQDAEKRQKDFYVDLDSRLRHFETAEQAAKAAAGVSKTSAPAESSGPVAEDRAFATAYGLFNAGTHADAVKAFQDFLDKYPDSIHVPNATYWLGKSQFAGKDYKGALNTYAGLLKNFPDTPKTADLLLEIAECQQGLKRPVSARKTLKHLVSKYPASKAAAKAKKLLSAAK
jgi:tol-pal system protein YbgF